MGGRCSEEEGAGGKAQRATGQKGLSGGRVRVTESLRARVKSPNKGQK